MTEGRLFEMSFFGLTVNPHNEELLSEVKRGAIRRCFLSCFYAAIKKRPENWNPRWPKKDTKAMQLFCTIRDHLKMCNQRFLRLHCTLGTELDYLHNADGVFELCGALLPFDLTTSDTDVIRITKVNEMTAYVITKRMLYNRSLKEVLAPQMAHVLEYNLNQKINTAKLHKQLPKAVWLKRLSSALEQGGIGT